MRFQEIRLPCGALLRSSLLSDAVDFFLDGEMIEGRQRQREEKADPAIEMDESVAESLIDLFRCSSYCSGIRNPPMSSHRLARPDGADLAGSVVANSKNKIQFGRAGLGEFVPRL